MTPTPEQEAIIAGEKLCYLATVRRDGTPQLTPVNFVYVDGSILISITKDRAKYHNVRRNASIALCIPREGGRPYVTVFGKARIEENDIVDGTAQIIQNMGRDVPGDRERFAAGLAEQRRVLLIVTPERFVP